MLPHLEVGDADGAGYAVLKGMCENPGVAEQSQAEKLRKLPWATTTKMVAVAEDGKAREMFYLHVDSVPPWLAIHLNKVAADGRRLSATRSARVSLNARR